MDTLTKLRDLNLAGNQITTIGTSLERFTDLEVVNLSGNKIALFKVGPAELMDVNLFLQPHNHESSLISPPPPLASPLSSSFSSSPQDLVHLCSLPKLHTLSLCEPLYRPNPVCHLCNYSTHTLYHLPQLQCLDGKDVSSPELHKLIQVRLEGGEGERSEKRGGGRGEWREREEGHVREGGRSEKRGGRGEWGEREEGVGG